MEAIWGWDWGQNGYILNILVHTDHLNQSEPIRAFLYGHSRPELYFFHISKISSKIYRVINGSECKKFWSAMPRWNGPDGFWLIEMICKNQNIWVHQFLPQFQPHIASKASQILGVTGPVCEDCIWGWKYNKIFTSDIFQRLSSSIPNMTSYDNLKVWILSLLTQF